MNVSTYFVGLWQVDHQTFLSVLSKYQTEWVDCSHSCLIHLIRRQSFTASANPTSCVAVDRSVHRCSFLGSRRSCHAEDVVNQPIDVSHVYHYDSQFIQQLDSLMTWSILHLTALLFLLWCRLLRAADNSMPTKLKLSDSNFGPIWISRTINIVLSKLAGRRSNGLSGVIRIYSRRRREWDVDTGRAP